MNEDDFSHAALGDDPAARRVNEYVEWTMWIVNCRTADAVFRIFHWILIAPSNWTVQYTYSIAFGVWNERIAT